MGRWIDFQNDYKTLYPWFMESIWWGMSLLYSVLIPIHCHPNPALPGGSSNNCTTRDLCTEDTRYVHVHVGAPYCYPGENHPATTRSRIHLARDNRGRTTDDHIWYRDAVSYHSTIAMVIIQSVHCHWWNTIAMLRRLGSVNAPYMVTLMDTVVGLVQGHESGYIQHLLLRLGSRRCAISFLLNFFFLLGIYRRNTKVNHRKPDSCVLEPFQGLEIWYSLVDTFLDHLGY